MDSDQVRTGETAHLTRPVESRSPEGPIENPQRNLLSVRSPKRLAITSAISTVSPGMTTTRGRYDEMLDLYPDRVNPGALWGSTRAQRLFLDGSCCAIDWNGVGLNNN